MHPETSALKDPKLKWNGDHGKQDRRPKASTVVVLADVVGDALGVGDGTLLPLGSVLDIVDLAAGRSAHLFMEGPTVTVSVDYGALHSPIRRGDLVQCTARVVDVGSSSISVSVSAKREDLENALDGAKPSFVECFSAQLTFVAVDIKTGRPMKNVPSLLLNSDELAQQARVRACRASSREIEATLQRLDVDTVDSLPMEKCNDLFSTLRRGYKTVDDTRIEFRKQYLPRHENFGGIVFGGDILTLLERAALYCAKRFSGYPNVSCVYIHGLHFRLPIQPSYLLRSVARVVHVQRFIMEVEVTVYVDRQHEGRPLEVSHVGFFSVIAHDENGLGQTVPFGLDLENSSEEAKRSCCKAALRLGQEHIGVNCEEYLTKLFASSRSSE